jgi:hypothetical protein
MLLFVYPENRYLAIMVVFQPSVNTGRRRRRNAMANIFDGFSDEDIEILRSPYVLNDDVVQAASVCSQCDRRKNHADSHSDDGSEANMDEGAANGGLDIE